jgi:hypothetical protein
MSDSDKNSTHSPRLIVAAVALGVLLAVGVIVVASILIGQGNRAHAIAVSSSAGNPPASTAPTAADASVCGLPGYQSTGTLAKAPATKWSLVGTMQAPSYKGVGPGVVESNGFRSCFAHTVEGALFATASYAAVTTDGSYSLEAAQKLIVPGAGQQADEATAKAGGPHTGANLQVAGFSIGSYTGRTATVTLVFQGTDGELVSVPIELQWSAGDWKQILTPDGQTPLNETIVSSLDGFTPWAAG